MSQATTTREEDEDELIESLTPTRRSRFFAVPIDVIGQVCNGVCSGRCDSFMCLAESDVVLIDTVYGTGEVEDRREHYHLCMRHYKDAEHSNKIRSWMII